MNTETLTFLFTDIEGSTALLSRLGGASYGTALEDHHRIIRNSLEAFGGVEQGTQGDSFFAVFPSPSACVAAALQMQRDIGAHAWPDGENLRVRMGIHTGEASEKSTGMVGFEVHRAARIAAVGHGGQILVSSSTMALVQDSLPPETTLVDLGPHRLKDLQRPEVIFQLTAQDLDEQFPPLRSLASHETPGNLPVQLTSFVGREDDVELVSTLLRTHRLVTLTGVGGVGKTRLALQVAAQLLPEARDGVWLCELAVADAEEAAVEILTRALGVVPRAGMTPRESILDHLRERDCLIVLDNCEHLLDVVAGLTDAILLGCQRVRVLATSREGLGIDGEQLRPIRSLPLPEAATVTAVMSADATALFAERAASVAPTFRLDESNAPAVVEICRRLDGIPLAIELAAARVASLQPMEIAALLDERFRLLTGSRRRGVERHQTLRATVDWSYSLLRELERTVFDRLGVFVGSFDTTAAQSVAADATVGRFDVLDVLDELVAKSMLMAEPTPEGTTRYQLLETLRQYALERLEQSGEVDVYRRRHAEHYVSVTAEIGGALYGSDEVRSRIRLDREIDNLRPAVDWSIDTGDSALVCGIIAPVAREVAWNRGSEFGSWAQRALVISADDLVQWQWVCLAAGLKAFFADADFAESLRVADSILEDPNVPAVPRLDALVLRAISLAQFGDIEGCVATLDEACQWRTDSNVDPHDPTAISASANLAVYLIFLGEPQRAVTAAADSLQRAQALGGPSTLSLAYFAVGFAYQDLDPTRAIASFEEALRFSDLGASTIVRDRSMLQLALLSWRGGGTKAAAHHLGRALDDAFAMGDFSACSYTLHLAVPVFADGERWQTALAIDDALTDGTLPAPAFSQEDITEGRKRAVEVCRATLSTGPADLGVAGRDRDAIIRYAIAELENLAQD
jgi:predicted ATPase/class 3 adenylate cyclase